MSVALSNNGNLISDVCAPTRFAEHFGGEVHFLRNESLKPVSPLVLSAVGGAPGVLKGLLMALSDVYDGGKPGATVADCINTPDPRGRLPLIEAIVR